MDRLPGLLDPDEFEAVLTGALAAIALDPEIPAAYAGHRAQARAERENRKKKRKPPAAASFREE